MALVLLRLTAVLGHGPQAHCQGLSGQTARKGVPGAVIFRLLAESGDGQDKEMAYLEAWRPKFVLEKLERGWKAATGAGGGLPGVTRVRSARSHGPEPKPVGTQVVLCHPSNAASWPGIQGPARSLTSSWPSHPPGRCPRICGPDETVILALQGAPPPSSWPCALPMPKGGSGQLPLSSTPPSLSSPRGPAEAG